MTRPATRGTPAPGMLSDLVAAARRQTARRRATVPVSELRARIRSAPPVRDLATALRRPGLGVIAEMKRRSPSRGLLTDDYRPADRARAYARGGAAAISVLTHEEGFGGAPEHLAQVRAVTGLPVLRKDFVVEDYQVEEARALGADALLLIVAALPADQLAELLARTRALGMEALVEVHDASEVDVALSAGAGVVGVNHRDLRTFAMDTSLTGRLRGRVGDGPVLVAESGVGGAADARAQRAVGADAVLVGEMLMRSPHPETTIMELHGDLD